MKTRFEWDPDKAARNWTKQDVSFATATRVFSDLSSFIKQDRVVDGEQRWQLFGSVDGVEVLVVVHTVHEQDDIEVIRIISARKAERWERKEYEQENGYL